MKTCIDAVQIIPVKPKEGLVAFANIEYDQKLFLGSIAIYTRPEGGYRLVYPRKGSRDCFNIFHPITRSCAEEFDEAIIGKYEEFMEEVNNMREVI